jgi:hypothetical protein
LPQWWPSTNTQSFAGSATAVAQFGVEWQRPSKKLIPRSVWWHATGVVGASVGATDGGRDGTNVGSDDGASVGAADGAAEGMAVGATHTS